MSSADQVSDVEKFLQLSREQVENDIQLGCLRRLNIPNFNRDDGSHLDAFVDCIESAGYSIQRLENYGEWFQ